MAGLAHQCEVGVVRQVKAEVKRLQVLQTLKPTVVTGLALQSDSAIVITAMSGFDKYNTLY